MDALFYAGKARRELTFDEGELVFLKLQRYKQKSLAAGANQKLSWKYYGPYKVAKWIGKVAYSLELGHFMFNPSGVSCLAAQKSSWG